MQSTRLLPSGSSRRSASRGYWPQVLVLAAVVFILFYALWCVAALPVPRLMAAVDEQGHSSYSPPRPS